jgi:hypothetical protein
MARDGVGPSQSADVADWLGKAKMAVGSFRKGLIEKASSIRPSRERSPIPCQEWQITLLESLGRSRIFSRFDHVGGLASNRPRVTSSAVLLFRSHARATHG